MNVELSREELALIAQALDTHVREHGIKVTTPVASLLKKLQQASSTPQPQES